MTNLSDLFPAGAGKQVSFVAAGAISAAGKPVVLNSAGTVTPVSESTYSPSMPLGSITTIDTDKMDGQIVRADPNNDNRWLIAWRDDVQADNYDIRVRVATRSGTSWTLSPISEVYGGSTSAPTTNIGLCWDVVTANQFLIIFNNTSNDGSAKVGTISGSAGSESISYGTLLNAFTSTQMKVSLSVGEVSLNAIGTSGNYFATWCDGSNDYPVGRVLTISGTTVSATGSDTVIRSYAMKNRVMKTFVNPWDTTKAVMGFIHGTDPTGDMMWVADIGLSGTTISYVSETRVEAGEEYEEDMYLMPISQTKFLIGSWDKGDFYSYVYIGTLSSGTFSFNSRTATQTSMTMRYSGSASNLTEKNSTTDPNIFAIVGRKYSDEKVYGSIGTVNEAQTTISFSTITALDSSDISRGNQVALQNDSYKHFAIVNQIDPASTALGKLNLGYAGGTASTLTSTNFIGISDAAISDTASGNVTIKGGIAVNGLSSLTIGSDYYVTPAGAFSTSAGTPSVKAGLAISATSLLLNGGS